MNRRIKEFAFAVVFALVPSIVLYLVFKEANLASFENDAVKLGGPAALFFVILTTALKYFARKIRDPLADVRDKLLGLWGIVAVSANGHEATSSCSVDEKDGRLTISGGQFVAGEATVGFWKVTASCLTDQSLTYVYDLRESGAGAAATWKGIVELTIPQTKRPDVLRGMWEVVGEDYKSGHIEWTRKASG